MFMKYPLTLLCAALALSACSSDAPAQAPGASTPATQATGEHANLINTLNANLARAGIDHMTITKAQATSSPGIFWVAGDDDPQGVFTDAAGAHIFPEVFSLEEGMVKSLTEDFNAPMAAAVLANVDPSEMIVFTPSGETKTHIYVFSDPTCHYCQMLHGDVDALNDAGIEVRYLAFPRGEQMIPMTEAIWCSPNRQQAMTDAKQGNPPSAPACANPVRAHHDLGVSLGVQGTPAIFAANGTQLGGYVPPSELAHLAITNQ